MNFFKKLFKKIAYKISYFFGTQYHKDENNRIIEENCNEYFNRYGGRENYDKAMRQERVDRSLSACINKKNKRSLDELDKKIETLSGDFKETREELRVLREKNESLRVEIDNLKNESKNNDFEIKNTEQSTYFFKKSN